MGKILLDTNFPNNPAWIRPGGAYALALHLGALAYSDGQGLDGVIPKILVPHLSLACPGTEVGDAVDVLLEAGFWSEVSRDNYAINDYDKTNFTKAQADAYRDKEALKKRRQRLHNADDHSLCTSARWCAKVREEEKLSPRDTKGTGKGTGRRDTRGSIPVNTIRPLGSNGIDGNGVAGSSTPGLSGPASAGATASPGREPTRTMANGFIVTASMVGGVDPNTLTQYELEDAMCESALTSAD